MPRSSESQELHKQLIQSASKRLEEEGYEPVQHVGIEGAGRPDIAGRSKNGRFEVIVECFLKQPSEKQLVNLRKKYKQRRLVIVIPKGMEFPRDLRKYIDDVWEFYVMQDGKVILPLGSVEADPQILQQIESRSSQLSIARDSMTSYDLITKTLFDELAKKAKRPPHPNE